VKHVLFVCTGNSCRSVMAQELMRHLLARAGIDAVQVDSAGVFAIHGMAPTRETVRTLQEAGVPVSEHRARLLTPLMVQSADLILVMEQFQAEEVLRRDPGARSKMHLLKTYLLPPTEPAPANPNIADPIGKPLEIYEVCFAEIREAVERLAKSLGVSTAS
jgi:protein-tyrosine-phosphatase